MLTFGTTIKKYTKSPINLLPFGSMTFLLNRYEQMLIFEFFQVTDYQMLEISMLHVGQFRVTGAAAPLTIRPSRLAQELAAAGGGMGTMGKGSIQSSTLSI